MRIISAFLALVTVFFFCSYSLIAQSINKNAFTLTPSFGFFWGLGEEIVYPENLSESLSPYTSQLLWDFKPLVYFGLDIEYGARYPWEKNGIYTGLSLKYGLPLNTGSLEDRDWLSGTGNYLTNYSKHDAYSQSSPGDLISGYGTFTADLRLGYSLAFVNRLWLKLYGNLSYLRFSWMSQDGYTQYSPSGNVPWDPSLPKESYHGPAIAYKQNWFIIAPGISFGINFLNSFSASLSGAITPTVLTTFIYGECVDRHFARNSIFYDYPSGGLYVRIGGEFIYTMTNHIGFTFSTAWMQLKDARGKSYTNIEEKKVILKNSAGGGFSFWDFSLSLKYTF
jgi:outer membrane protease